MSQTPPAPLLNRVALVTGAGRGIGRSIAIGLAGMGAKVALASRSAKELDEVAALITSQGGTATTVVADIGKADQRVNLVQRVGEQLGTIEILVNNAAALGPIAPSTTIDINEYRDALEINVVALVALSIAVLPPMLESNWGRIINISSIIVGRPSRMIGANAYAATKAAVEALTINLAAEIEGSGVTVNAYRPGGVDTDMQGWIRAQSPDQVGEKLHELFVTRFESGALISPDQSAAGLLYRIPSEATGEVWDVDDK